MKCPVWEIDLDVKAWINCETSPQVRPLNVTKDVESELIPPTKTVGKCVSLVWVIMHRWHQRPLQVNKEAVAICRHFASNERCSLGRGGGGRRSERVGKKYWHFRREHEVGPGNRSVTIELDDRRSFVITPAVGVTRADGNASAGRAPVRHWYLRTVDGVHPPPTTILAMTFVFTKQTRLYWEPSKGRASRKL